MINCETNIYVCMCIRSRHKVVTFIYTDYMCLSICINLCVCVWIYMYLCHTCMHMPRQQRRHVLGYIYCFFSFFHSLFFIFCMPTLEGLPIASTLSYPILSYPTLRLVGPIALHCFPPVPSTSPLSSANYVSSWNWHTRAQQNSNSRRRRQPQQHQQQQRSSSRRRRRRRRLWQQPS